MKILINERLSEHKYKTPEGYLICVDAVLARTGKQTYKRSEVFDTDDNSDIEIDRTDKEVFSEATLASFENKPITVEHPNEDVNSENIKEYSVGFVRDVHKGYDNGQPVILGTLVIQDADTIEEIENGEHTELSCGYDCDIVDEENPQQRNIRGNHVALCQCGRAGNARIVDSVKDELYSLQELREMRIDNYRDVDIYKINGKFSTNPNTSKERFDTFEEVKKYIDTEFRDFVKDVSNMEYYKGFVFSDYDKDAPYFTGFNKEKEVQKIGNDYIVYVKNSMHGEVYNIINNYYKTEGFTVIIEPGKIEITRLKKYKEYNTNLIKAAKQIENTDNINFVDSKEKESVIDATEYRIVNHNNKWYYEMKQDDGFVKLVGPYISEEEAREYFMKHRPNEKLRDVEPRENESKEDFISRFMSEAKEEYPDEKQRLAIAYSYWNKKSTKDEETPYEEVTKNLEKNINDQSDLSLLKEYFNERQPNKKMELRHKLKEMNYKEGVSGVNSRELMWVELNGKRYEVKNLSSVKPFDSIKDDYFTSLPDKVKKSEFNNLYYKIREQAEKKWNYRVSSYGDKFKIEVEKAVGAAPGTYGPVGGRWKTIKTIYSIEDSIKDSYIIQSKYNTENYLQEDNHFGMNKKFAQKFNSYEEAAKKANILYSDWDKHINIIKDSKTPTKLSTIVKLVKAVKFYKDSIEIVSEWIKK